MPHFHQFDEKMDFNALYIDIMTPVVIIRLLFQHIHYLYFLSRFGPPTVIKT